MECLGRCIEQLCGVSITAQQEELDNLRVRIRRMEDDAEVKQVSEELYCEPCSPVERESGYSKDEINGLMNQVREDAELTAKEHVGEQVKQLRVDLEHKEKQIHKLEIAKQALREESEKVAELIRKHEYGSMTDEQLAGIHETIFDRVTNIIKKNNNSGEDNEEARAFRLDWESLKQIQILENNISTPIHLKEQYKVRHQMLLKCPKRGTQTLVDWQQAVFDWSKKLLEVGVTMDDLGEKVISDGLEGYRHEQRRARAVGKDLVKVMMRLEEESCPLVRNVVADCYRLIPQLKRWKDMTPLAWVGVLEDVFEKEEQVCGGREDQSKWEYSLQSLMLDKTTTQHLRTMFRSGKDNNFAMLKTRLNSMNVNDTARYFPDGRIYNHTRGRNEKDPLEELCISLGEHTHIEAHVTSTKEVNRAINSILGTSYAAAVMGNSNATTGTGASDQGPSGPEPTGQSFFGGGGNGNTSVPTPREDGWLTKEQLKELNETPCKFGPDCWNLKNKGRCLRKHTIADLKAGDQYFRKNHPEKAVEKDAVQKKRKEEQAAKKKKEKEASASASASGTS
eukprot:g18233.t1